MLNEDTDLQKTHYLKIFMWIFPLPDNKILDWSRLKQIADHNFKFDENSRKFSIRVETPLGNKPFENTVGKGEIARYKQFLLFPQCFQKACFPGASKSVVWEWVNLDIFNALVRKEKWLRKIQAAIILRLS